MNQTDIKRLADFSDRVREATIKRLRLVPAGKENMSFPEGSMSPADIAAHLVHIDEVMIDLPKTRFKGKDLGVQGQGRVRSRDEYDNRVLELSALKDKRRDFILAQDDDSLAVAIEFEALSGSGTTDLGAMIYRLLDHEIHHRGALAVYLRAYEKGF